jgi:hypothetical protein
MNKEDRIVVIVAIILTAFIIFAVYLGYQTRIKQNECKRQGLIPITERSGRVVCVQGVMP